MNFRRIYIVFFTLVYKSIFAFIFSPLHDDSIRNASSHIWFAENKGQWKDGILYQGKFYGGKVFLEKNEITYLFYPKEGIKELYHKSKNHHTDSVFTVHALKMSFLNSNSNSYVIKIDSNDYYENYIIGNDSKKWASHVKSYKQLVYQNLYNNIDLKILSTKNNFRYDFVLHAGANLNDIALKWQGDDGLEIKEGKLFIKTAVGIVYQTKPYAYQIINNKKQSVECSYVLENHVLKFKINGQYNKEVDLIIDPTLIYATYTGSLSDNFGMTATYDNFGNGYTAGICFGTQYPVTVGAFQTTFAGPFGSFSGGKDISISKFDPTGSTLLYSTYLGGSGHEEPESIVVDNANELVVFGRTNSTNFPITASVFQPVKSGGYDFIITKLNVSGSGLSASTHLGGTLNEGVNSIGFNYEDALRGSVITDINNNIYIGASTNSTDFPVTSGCFQSTLNGSQDGVVAKFNPQLTTPFYITYLGGGLKDAVYSITLNQNNQLYVCGGTESNDFYTNIGALNPIALGGLDGFVSLFANNGNSVLASSYLGSPLYNQAFFVQTDNQNKVYVYGQTIGSYPVTSGVYTNPNSGQFIHCLDPNLSSTFFSTVVGRGTGFPDIVPSAFLVDVCGNIYIAGWGGTLFGNNNANSGTTGLPVTPNAFMSFTDDNDFYFMVLDKNALTLQYASFFGGFQSQEHVDGGTSRFDKSGIIYQAICESCGGFDDMPSTPSAYSTQNGSTNCNNALVKFSFNQNTTVAQLAMTTPTPQGCSSQLTVNFTNTSTNGVNYFWDFGDGTTSTITSPVHTYTSAGTFTIQLISNNINTCNINDTTYSSVTVYPPLAINPIPNITICIGDTATLNSMTPVGCTYTWSPVSMLIGNPNMSNPKTAPIVDTKFYVTINYHGCIKQDSMIVFVKTLTDAQLAISPSNQGCAPHTVNFTNTSVNGITYSWSFGDGGLSSLVSPIHTYTAAGVYTVQLISHNVNSCNIHDTTYTVITVFPPIIISPMPNIIMCLGDTVQLNQIAPAGSLFSWTPANLVSNSAISNPTTSPTSDTKFYVTISNNGCSVLDSVTVFVQTNTTAQLTLLPSNSGCAPHTVNFTNTSINGTTYHWDFGDGNSSTSTSPIHTYTVAGSYTVQLISNNINSCNKKDTTYTVITVYPPLIVPPMANVNMCVGDTVILNQVAPTGCTFAWTPTNLVSNANINNPKTSPLVDTKFVVTVSKNGCSIKDSVTVFVFKNDTKINVLASNACLDDTVKLFASQPCTSYLWSSGQTTQQINVLVPGWVYLTTINSHGCIAKDSVRIDSLHKIPLGNYNFALCLNQSLQLLSPAGYSYLWLPNYEINNQIIFNPIVSPKYNTTYTLTLNNGPCQTTGTYFIKVNPLPTLTVTPKYAEVISGDDVILNVYSDTIATWTPPNYLSCTFCNYNISKPDDNITYTVTVKNKFGCIINDNVEIKIIPTLYVPNCFTPNGDNINDIFKPEYTGYVSAELLIFDRWGVEIFKTNELYGGWNGTYKNTPCQIGVYTYKLIATDYKNNTVEKIGHVTLVR